MTNVVGFYSACELVWRRTPFDVAVTALVDQLQITTTEAAAAMNAAHERSDWGLDPGVAVAR
jgi:hypothetical protein